MGAAHIVPGWFTLDRDIAGIATEVGASPVAGRTHGRPRRHGLRRRRPRRGASSGVPGLSVVVSVVGTEASVRPAGEGVTTAIGPAGTPDRSWPTP